MFNVFAIRYGSYVTPVAVPAATEDVLPKRMANTLTTDHVLLAQTDLQQ